MVEKEAPSRPSADLKYRLTPRMRAVEDKLALKGERLPDALYRLYWEEGQSLVKIGHLVDTADVTIARYIKSFGIEVRRSEALTRAWKNNKEEKVAKLHTPLSDKKRADSKEKYYADHPQYRIEVGEAKREEYNRRLQGKLGEDLKVGLKTLINRGFTIDGIRQELGYTSPASVYRLLNGHDLRDDIGRRIPPGRPSVKDLSGLIMEGIAGNVFFEKLTEREQEILLGRAGITQIGKSLPLRAFTDRYGISSTEGIRLIEAKATKKLQLGISSIL